MNIRRCCSQWVCLQGALFALIFHVFMVSVFSIEASARDQDVNEDIFKARMEYNGSRKLPDEIAFYALAGDWTTAAEQVGLETFAANIHMITGLSKDSSTHLVKYVLDAAGQMEEEIVSTVRMVVCPPHVSIMSKDQYAELGNMGDDIKSLSYERYYMMTKAQLPPEEARALQSLLEQTKLSTSFTRLDHKSLYANKSVEDVRYRFQTYCNQGGL